MYQDILSDYYLNTWKNQLLALISVDQGKSWKSWFTPISVKCNTRINFTGTKLFQFGFWLLSRDLLTTHPAMIHVIRRHTGKDASVYGAVSDNYAWHFVKINNDPTVGCLGRSQLKGLADRDFSGWGQPWHGPSIGAKQWHIYSVELSWSMQRIVGVDNWIHEDEETDFYTL